ncbi:aminoglycoside phosphotransferase family protein [Streptomyces sp. NPDC002454]|uniref:aminoglycoside phosphotransferase family protein n=1 Tax=unclassified Streptomyces TaxID=2593676 RepID=UPI00332E489D
MTEKPQPRPLFEIPAELIASQHRYKREAGRAFIADLPRRAAEFVERWELSVTGPAMHGMASLVLPVDRADGTPAVLKMQVADEESEHQGLALRLWDGRGCVRLLEEDGRTTTQLLERADGGRSLDDVADSRAAVAVIGELLARLTAVPGPAGMRHLADIAADMLAALPAALEGIEDPGARRVLDACGEAVREVLPEPGDRLLHWDLHFDNVLAATREPWLAIDPNPLVGDPGFDLMPALDNRYEDGETLWRFDHLTERLGLDRARAARWTLARVLQNSLWDVEDGEPLQDVQLRIAERLLSHRLG